MGVASKVIGKEIKERINAEIESITQRKPCNEQLTDGEKLQIEAYERSVSFVSLVCDQ